MDEQRHTSPDGKLTLVVERLDDEGDLIIYFDDFPWHTHPDLLGGAAETEAFINDILSDRLSVLVERRKGEVSDISIRSGSSSEDDDLPQDVVIEVRTWSGR